MKMISDFRQRHLSAWTRGIRELKPKDIDAITELPDIEFNEVSVKAAISAGWFSDVSDPDIVDDMRYPEVEKAAGEVWKAFNEARKPDPN